MKILLLFSIIIFNGGLYSADDAKDAPAVPATSILMLRFHGERKSATVGYALRVPARLTMGYDKDKVVSDDMVEDIRKHLAPGDLELFNEWVKSGIKPLEVFNIK